MTDRVRIGIIGLGTFVEIAHLPAYFDSAHRDRADVVAICDLDEDRLRTVGDAHGIPARFTDHRALLAEASVDAVAVVTPDHTHTPIVLDAIAAKKDVLVEKPLTMKTSEARQIVRAAEEAGVLVLTDFHKREDPCHVEARTRIREGAYGRLQFGWAWMQDTISVPAGGFFKSNLAGRSSPNWFLGVHFYDLIRFLTGLEPREVRATGYRHVLVQRGIPTYDAVKADFVLDNGAAVSVFTSWNLPDAAPLLTRQGVYLQFSAGDVEIDSTRRGFAATSSEAYRFVNPMFLRRTPEGQAGYGIDSIGAALGWFLRLKTGARDQVLAQAAARACTARDGLRATLMGEAVDRSLAEGREADGVVTGAVVTVSSIPGALDATREDARARTP
jgi:predicted dehydrogenase